MIDFEAELEKFQPSLEIERAEDAIYGNNTTDVTDLLQTILSGNRGEADATKEWVEEK